MPRLHRAANAGAAAPLGAGQSSSPKAASGAQWPNAFAIVSVAAAARPLPGANWRWRKPALPSFPPAGSGRAPGSKPAALRVNPDNLAKQQRSTANAGFPADCFSGPGYNPRRPLRWPGSNPAGATRRLRQLPCRPSPNRPAIPTGHSALRLLAHPLPDHQAGCHRIGRTLGSSAPGSPRRALPSPTRTETLAGKAAGSPPTQGLLSRMQRGDAGGLFPGKTRRPGKLRMLPSPLGNGLPAAAAARHSAHRQGRDGRQRMPPDPDPARIRRLRLYFPQRQFQPFPITGPSLHR